MLEHAIAVIGPPGAGKTMLTARLGQFRATGVFRLPEHVPQTVLAPTAGGAAQPRWLDDFTVITSVHEYIERLGRQGDVRTLVLDGFPCTGTQVSLFLSVLRQHAADCAVSVVELTSYPMHPGRDYDPIMYDARMRRYREMADGIRRAFASAGITIRRLDRGRSLSDIAHELMAISSCGKAMEDVP
jgi:adenylate kinase